MPPLPPPRIRSAPLLGALLVLAGAAAAFGADPVLDKQKQLDRFAWRDNQDDDWLKQRIPFFESPDPDIDAVYYYRWELVTKHLAYVSPRVGYVVRELLSGDAGPGRYGADSGALGLQLYELRWLKDRRITDDFVRYWYDAPQASPRGRANWYGDAVWANYLVNGDREFAVGRLPSLEAQCDGWTREWWDPQRQMLHGGVACDGMAYTLASRQTSRPADGADGYRPTLNSYLYGDLVATANLATLAGQADKAGLYRERAQALKARVEEELWDARRRFFFGQFRTDEVSDGGSVIRAGSLLYQDGRFAGDGHGRELSGYVPWMFHLPDPGRGYEAAWNGVADPDVFLARYGLTFAERHDPLFLIGGDGNAWSGSNRPSADSQVLAALANVIDDYPQSAVGKDDYFKVFKAYTGCHLAGTDRTPYVAEDQDPDTGRWLRADPDRGGHAFDSSYVDLLISGLVGLRPRFDGVVEVAPLVPDSWDYFALDGVAYHGRSLSIVWDRDGTRYRRGAGLTVLADGTPIAHSATLARLQGGLPSPQPPFPPVDRPANFAANVDDAPFPRIAASFTAAGTRTENLNDGVYYYHLGDPENRWTNVGSPNPTDWVKIDFGLPRPVGCLKLYFLDDGPGGAVRAPASFAVESWNGMAWVPVPGQRRTPEAPEGRRPSVVEFPPVSTSSFRIVITSSVGAGAGLTEVEAWGRPVPSPATAKN